MKNAARLASILFKIAVAFSLIEGSVRLVALLGLVELPPAGIAAFDVLERGTLVPAAERLMIPDRNLIQRMRPDFEKVYDRRILFDGKGPTYEVRTNEHGFRNASFDPKKPPGVFRIVCLGDSSTFGFNIEQEDAYPQVLGRLLAERFPGRFEVLNLGTPGYTTRQGLELLRREVMDLEPDLVTFAFGTNDQFFRGPLSDDEVIRFNQSRLGGVVAALQSVTQHLDMLRLMRKVTSWLVRRPSAAPAQGQTEPRVSLDDIQKTITAAGALLEPIGAPLVVLNNDFFATKARSALAAGAERAGADFLDMRALLDANRNERTRQLEAELHLPPANRRDGMVLLRVLAPANGRVSVRYTNLWTGEKLLQLRDDGADGDQMAGDGVWSGYVPGHAGKDTLHYTYVDGAVNPPRREFVDTSFAPSSRSQPAPRSGIGALDVFGEMVLFSDGSHPDEEGQRRIAAALLGYLLENHRVREFLATHPSQAAHG